MGINIEYCRVVEQGVQLINAHQLIYLFFLYIFLFQSTHTQPTDYDQHRAKQNRVPELENRSNSKERNIVNERSKQKEGILAPRHVNSFPSLYTHTPIHTYINVLRYIIKLLLLLAGHVARIATAATQKTLTTMFRAKRQQKQQQQERKQELSLELVKRFDHHPHWTLGKMLSGRRATHLYSRPYQSSKRAVKKYVDCALHALETSPQSPVELSPSDEAAQIA